MSSDPQGFATPDDLRSFLERHGVAYDPQEDDYDRPVFVADIKEGKNDPIYNAHSYHTKVPPRAIVPYILHYSRPGDVVLDPFCGSGMTGVAALMCVSPPTDILEQYPEFRHRVGIRHTILNDLSPAACHIAYNYCTPVDIRELVSHFQQIVSTLKDEFAWLYGTEHYEPAIGAYNLSVPEIAARIKNLPESRLSPAVQVLRSTLGEPCWELIDRAELERRLGYPATRLNFAHRSDLLKDSQPGSPPAIDVESVDHWVVVPATLCYVVWSDVHKCQGTITIEEPTGKISSRGKNAGKPIVRKKRVPRGCGEEIVLWDAAVEQKSGTVLTAFDCPRCGQKWEKIAIPRVGTFPVVSRIAYMGVSKQHSYSRLSLLEYERPTSAREHERLNDISGQGSVSWTPDVRLNPADPQYTRNALGGRRIQSVRDFFTPRSLRALGRVFEEIYRVDDLRIRRALQFVFTSTFGRITRTTRYLFRKAGNSSITGTLYFPSFSVENNFVALLSRKFENCEKGLAEAAKYMKAEVVVHNGSATTLPLPSESIDYVFCDPPFGANIYYSEVNLLWEAWLGGMTDRTEEAVVHREQDGGTKRLPDYATLMASAFREIWRLLKPGRFATVEFNNSDGEVFEAIKNAVRSAGFEISNMLFLDKDQKTFKQIKGVKGEQDVVGHDVIFNLQKPRSGQQLANKSEDATDLYRVVADAIAEHLRGLPEKIASDPITYTDDCRTTPFLNTMLMKSLLREFDVSCLNLPFIEQVCSRYFRKLDGRWYLRNEAVGNGLAGGVLVEHETEIVDELSAIGYLRQQLCRQPMMIGELKPLWFRATARLSGEMSLQLDRLLRENFWYDRATNKYSEPTEEQRALMDTTEREQARHDAERFLAGSLSRSATDTEICGWIGHLYESVSAMAGGSGNETTENGNSGILTDEIQTLYEQMVRLFQGVLKERVDGKLYALTSRQVRIATSKMRSSEEMRIEAESVGKKADGQKSLFD